MKKTLLILFLLTLPAVSSLLRPGFYPMQDDLQAFRLKEMQSCFKDGQIPCRWTPLSGYGYGYPLFQYYAPAIFYLGQPLLALGIQAIDAVKILLVLAVLSGSLGMFLLISRLALFRPLSILIATIYTYLPYHAQQLYVRGALNELWVYALYPWVILSALRLFERTSPRRVAIFSLLLSWLLLTHNLMSVFILPIVILFSPNLKSIVKISVSIFISIILCSFFLLPLAVERNSAHLETLIGGYFGYHQHFVSVSQLFFSNYWGYGSSQLGVGDDLALSVGIVLWPLVLFGLFISLIKRRLSLLHLGLVLLSAVFMFVIHERSSPLWAVLSPLKWLQFPWRLLLPATFTLCLSLICLPKLISLKFLRIFSTVVVALTLILHGWFFQPITWNYEITDSKKFSSPNLVIEQTRSIFDYLPISAQLPPNKPAQSNPEILDSIGGAVYWTKGSNWQSGQITLASPAKLRFPIYDFPGMQVTVDNRIINHTHAECRNQDYCFGLVAAEVPAGTHLVEVRLTKTPARVLGDILTLVSGLVLLIFLCIS